MAVEYLGKINGYDLEFVEETHTYLVDGIIVPSVTQILQSRFGGKYRFVDKDVLAARAAEGTAVHKAIELWCKDGEESDLPELRNFKFLMDRYGFRVLQNEVPVLLYSNGDPVAAGRLDLVLEMGGKLGGADIKRTSSLDKQYLAYQLNLYRIAYRQSYGKQWEFLRGIHLRGDTRRFVDIPIAEEPTWELVWSYINEQNERRENSE